MKRLLGFVLAWPLLAWALPQLDLEVTLDPATRQFVATAIITDSGDIPGLTLAAPFEITAVKVNDRPATLNRRRASADFYPLPVGARRVELSYRATLAPTPTLDHRQVLAHPGASAGMAGSFLPDSARWYPRPGQRFQYRVTLLLPAGQKGLVAGTLVEEQEHSAGYRARFDFPQPADGIDLMAGPYAVSERSLKIDGRPIRLRTWFHAELADLAAGYLDDSARYLERYSQLIGAYPFASFSVVSSPNPTGFGMPTLTYLGRDVLKLPFIRATSLGHEVLHNWWGNGVYPDWQRGNWSEGLTTFLADYAYKEDESAAAARDMRLGWLRDYAAVPPGAEMALTDFTARHHGIASIIGYNKAAMVFFMLRDKIGRAAFERGLRLLWERKRFQTASWSDLEAAFSSASGQVLDEFFRQWVQQTDAPTAGPDPDYRTWRKLDPKTLPPILREVFVAPQATLIITEPALAAVATTLAARVLDARPATAHALSERPALVIGTPASMDAWLAGQRLPLRPLPLRGSAQVWAARAGSGAAFVAIAARDADALAALLRPLPHYGKQGWLVFEGGRVVDKGM